MLPAVERRAGLASMLSGDGHQLTARRRAGRTLGVTERTRRMAWRAEPGHPSRAPSPRRSPLRPARSGCDRDRAGSGPRHRLPKPRPGTCFPDAPDPGAARPRACWASRSRPRRPGAEATRWGRHPRLGGPPGDPGRPERGQGSPPPGRGRPAVNACRAQPMASSTDIRPPPPQARSAAAAARWRSRATAGLPAT
jgi:hypothetical protein